MQPEGDQTAAKASSAAGRLLLPWSGLIVLVALWWLGVRAARDTLLPTPLATAKAIVELAQRGLLVRHAVASLFRVAWGYALAVGVGIPLGLLLGWSPRVQRAFGPYVQFFRPISPLAWIPIAILWLGVGDPPAVFIIFIATLWPITVACVNAVSNIPQVSINVGRNFGLSGPQLLGQVILPAVMPQLATALRVTIGIAWLVDVAAEMIAVNSGLGFLIIDSRNAGNRYDLVVAGMILIGIIGLGLDLLARAISIPAAARPLVSANSTGERFSRRRFRR